MFFVTQYIFIDKFFGGFMNKKELLENILKTKEISHLTKKDAETFLNAAIDVIRKTVKKGEDVALIGFGTFTKVKRNARMGVNPSTGEKIKIKAKVLPKFKAGKAWKDMM
jgi:DNA-binding protein HU-beta